MLQAKRNAVFEEVLTSRRSIRSFDPEVKISKEEMSEILSLASKAPSTANVQPWRVLVIESDSGKEQLAAMLDGNQIQNETSSAMLLVMADTEGYKKSSVIFDRAVEQNFMPKEVRDDQVSKITSSFSQMPMAALREFIKVDAGLFSMHLMLVAKSFGYDTNPMAGFNYDSIVEHFNLDDTKLIPVMLIAIGKANESGYPSIRLSPEEFTSWI